MPRCERERERERRKAVFNFQTLYRAYLDCRRNKRSTYYAAAFEEKVESDILALERELQEGTYRPGRSICFVVTDPTVREIWAATFRDRVVHHLLHDFLEPVFEPVFIHQSYACRAGKGTRRAVDDLRRELRSITQNGRRIAYCLQLDIRAFFMSLRKDILYRLVERRVRHPDLLWLTRLIIFHSPLSNHFRKGQRELFDLVPPHKSLFHADPLLGLPIGNLPSQFFANVYLNELDQFVKHRLRAGHYFRYVDDVLLLSRDPAELMQWRDGMDAFLRERLGLELHPGKQRLAPVAEGIDWLGYVISPDHVLVRRRVVRRFKMTLLRFDRELAARAARADDATAMPPRFFLERILASVNSSFGHFRYADSFRLRSRLWEQCFGGIRRYVEPTDASLRVFRLIEDATATAT